MRGTASALLLLALFACKPQDDDEPPVTLTSAVMLNDGMEGVGGPLAGSVPGDVYLANDKIRVVLQGPGRAIGLNPYGGNIIDADVLRGDEDGRDRFGELGVYLNASFTYDPQTVEIEQGVGEATVRFKGPAVISDFINAEVGLKDVLNLGFPFDTRAVPPLDVEVAYTLADGAGHVRIDVRATNTGQAMEPLFASWLAHAGLVEGYQPEQGGFGRAPIGKSGALTYASDELAYGVAPLPYELDAHGIGSLTGGSILLDSLDFLAVLNAAGWPQTATVQLDPGETFEYSAAFVVATDVNGVLQELRGLATDPVPTREVSGHVRLEGEETGVAGVTVSALAADKNTILATTFTDEDGAFALTIPDEAAELIAGKRGWPYASNERTPARVALGSGDADLRLPPTGALSATATLDGLPGPARLVVIGIDPSPPHPALEATDVDPLPPGVVAIVDLPASGQATFDLEPGDYDVVLTRGMEYDAVRTSITVVGGETALFEADLHHVLDHHGHVVR